MEKSAWETGCKRVDNIKRDLKEIGFGIYTDSENIQWLDFVMMVLNLRISKQQNFPEPYDS
jgi:hypothetical protein